MKLWTYQELENRVRRDLDLLDDDNFVAQDEMAGYFNEAIDSAEAEILKLNEDYFLTPATLSMVTGQSDISLPTDIYAQKIRSLIYQSGSLIYPIERIRDPDKFYRKAVQDYNPSGEGNYTYFLKNATAGAQAKIVLSPASLETSSNLTLWYIRNANRISMQSEDAVSRATQLATVIDIPEWADYLVQFVKCRCYEKEFDPRLQGAIAALADRKAMMVDTLQNRVPDNNDTVPMDVSFYEDMN